MFNDEPRFQKLKSFGQIYRAFSKMGEKVFFNSVLFPYFNNNEVYYTDNETLKGVDAYVDYIERWFRETDAESIDYYPFKFLRDPDCATDPTDSYIEITHFINLQLMADTARRLGKKFYITLQAYASAKKNALPYFPNGFTHFGAENVAAGFVSGATIYLVVWCLQGDTRAVVPLDREIADIALTYPSESETVYKVESGKLIVDFARVGSAAFFELSSKTV